MKKVVKYFWIASRKPLKRNMLDISGRTTSLNCLLLSENPIPESTNFSYYYYYKCINLGLIIPLCCIATLVEISLVDPEHIADFRGEPNLLRSTRFCTISIPQGCDIQQQVPHLRPSQFDRIIVGRNDCA